MKGFNMEIYEKIVLSFSFVCGCILAYFVS